MTDREMLDLAAKAAGYWSKEFNCPDNLPSPDWNPLDNDGDALRLAVKCLNWPFGGRAFDDAVTALVCINQLPKDLNAATRRAIVLAVIQLMR